MSGSHWGLVLAALLALATGAHARTEGARDDVRACRVEGGAVLVATGGGLARIGADRRVAWLDDRPATALSLGGSVVVGEANGWREPGGPLHPTPAPVRAVVDHAGARYLGTWGAGLLRDDEPVGFAGAPKGQAHRRVTAVVESGGTLYVGTAGGGLWRLRGAELVRERAVAADAWVTALAPGAPLRVATLAGWGPLGAPAAPRLVRAFVAGEAGWAPVDLPEGAAATAHAAGELACAGGSEGLWIRRGERWSRQLLGGAPANDVASVAWDGSRAWAGFFNAGLAVWDGRAWTPVGAGVIDRKVNVVATQGPVTWVGTARGLFRVEAGRVRRLGLADGLPHADIHAVVPLRDGRVLVGTGRGAALLGSGPVEVLGAKQGLPIKAVWAGAELNDGRLLLGTSSGLYLQADDGWRRLSVASGHLPDDWVTALATDGEVAWIGTYNAGVVRLDWAEGEPVATRLGGGWVNFNGLTRTEGAVYAATMDGLLRRADGASAWTPVLTGRDVTQLTVAGEDALIATRMGLVRQAR